jgi:putative two-component system response regulator
MVGPLIPLSARLMAVADVYDALISKRCYKPAFSHEKAVEIIREGKGKHFDPDIVDAFVEVLGDFQKIAAVYMDSDEDPKVRAKATADERARPPRHFVTPLLYEGGIFSNGVSGSSFLPSDEVARERPQGWSS